MLLLERPLLPLPRTFPLCVQWPISEASVVWKFLLRALFLAAETAPVKARMVLEQVAAYRTVSLVETLSPKLLVLKSTMLLLIGAVPCIPIRQLMQLPTLPRHRQAMARRPVFGLLVVLLVILLLVRLPLCLLARSTPRFPPRKVTRRKWECSALKLQMAALKTPGLV